MNKIGIFYGSEQGMTEAMAQVMSRVLGDDIASEPVNVNQAKVSDLLQYKALILDHHTQPEMTKARIIGWLDQIKPDLLEKLNLSS